MSSSSLPRIALVGDHGNHNEPAHPRIDEMVPHLPVQATWVPTVDIHDAAALQGFDAVWLVPGAPYFNQRGVHLAIRHARENGLPFLGTCGGFFSALIEHAQNVLHLPAAEGVDENPDKMLPLVTPLKCSFRGERAPLRIRENSRMSSIYGGSTEVEEVFHCDYGLTEDFMDAANQGQLSFSAWDIDGAPRGLEIAGHPFFVGTLFQPELSSTPESVHPIIRTFIETVLLTSGATGRAAAKDAA
ncbi:hypothetical protein [Kitasatospora sp. NPDC093806]|uniref:glutamine amidotransferase-related protein n=1 Tax=Kitasatospora sp. NPDC093806 TaxID=3155075 RepID=UPI0034334B45